MECILKGKCNCGFLLTCHVRVMLDAFDLRFLLFFEDIKCIVVNKTEAGPRRFSYFNFLLFSVITLGLSFRVIYFFPETVNVRDIF